MIPLIASLLGFGRVVGLSAHLGSANGPSGCPLCCGGSLAPGLEIVPKRLAGGTETAMPLLLGRTRSAVGNVLTAQTSPMRGGRF